MVGLTGAGMAVERQTTCGRSLHPHLLKRPRFAKASCLHSFDVMPADQRRSHPENKHFDHDQSCDYVPKPLEQ